MNNGAAFSLESNSWSTIGDYGLTPRIGHKAIMVEDSIFMFGGWDGPYAKFGPTGNKYRNNGVIISF